MSVRVRPQVMKLAEFGRLPSENDTNADFDGMLAALDAIDPPLTNDEARLVCSMFGEDTCNGFAFSLLHLVETSPGGPEDWKLRHGAPNDFVEMIWQRHAHRVGERLKTRNSEPADLCG